MLCEEPGWPWFLLGRGMKITSYGIASINKIYNFQKLLETVFFLPRIILFSNILRRSFNNLILIFFSFLLFSFSLDRCTSVFLHPSTKITRWNFLKTFNYLSSATLFADSFPIISTCDKTLVQEISGMRSFQPLYFSISLHHKRNFLFTLLFLCV